MNSQAFNIALDNSCFGLAFSSREKIHALQVGFRCAHMYKHMHICGHRFGKILVQHTFALKSPCSQTLSPVSLLCPHSHPMNKELLSQSYRKGTETENLSDLSKHTQHVGGGVGI